MKQPALSLLAISRRHFLRRMGLATGAAATLAPLINPKSFATTNGTPKHVIIVGAGLSGLCAAYEMEKRGHRVTILEANTSRIGGRVFTHRFNDGNFGELGAMRIPKDHNLTRHYVSEFGLSLRNFVQSNSQAYYHVRGKKIRITDEPQINALFNLTSSEADKSVGDFWVQSVLSILDGMSAEELNDLRRVEFQTQKVRHLDRMSFENTLKQSGLSDEAIEMLGTLWAYETSFQTALTVILREEYEGTWLNNFDEIVGGTDKLPYAFLKKLKSKPVMGAHVTRISQNLETKKVSTTYYDRNDHKKEHRIQGDLLLCTVPLGVMTRITFEPRLSGPKMRAMRQVTYDSAIKVLFNTRERFWELKDGIYGGGTYTDLPIGIVYYPSDNAAAKSAAVSRKGGVLLGSYCWGQQARRLESLPASNRVEVTKHSVANIHPEILEPGMIKGSATWAWDNQPYSSGAFAWFSPGQHESLYRHLISSEGRLFFAGEHASLTSTWMQGALESAMRAVEQMTTVT